tara:strand:- start:279 stop:596 length:318 start_codon:yes stop_codon:yes gene_type:complete
MSRRLNYSTSLRQDVLLLFDEGLTATQVAKIVNKRFRSETLGNLSRCAALGIKWRAGKCKKSYRSYYYPPRRSTSYNKSLAYNEKEDFKSKYEVSIKRLQTALKG